MPCDMSKRLTTRVTVVSIYKWIICTYTWSARARSRTPTLSVWKLNVSHDASATLSSKSLFMCPSTEYTELVAYYGEWNSKEEEEGAQEKKAVQRLYIDIPEKWNICRIALPHSLCTCELYTRPHGPHGGVRVFIYSQMVGFFVVHGSV